MWKIHPCHIELSDKMYNVTTHIDNSSQDLSSVACKWQKTAKIMWIKLMDNTKQKWMEL